MMRMMSRTLSEWGSPRRPPGWSGEIVVTPQLAAPAFPLPAAISAAAWVGVAEQLNVEFAVIQDPARLQLSLFRTHSHQNRLSGSADALQLETTVRRNRGLIHARDRHRHRLPGPDPRRLHGRPGSPGAGH